MYVYFTLLYTSTDYPVGGWCQIESNPVTCFLCEPENIPVVTEELSKRNVNLTSECLSEPRYMPDLSAALHHLTIKSKTTEDTPALQVISMLRTSL